MSAPNRALIYHQVVRCVEDEHDKLHSLSVSLTRELRPSDDDKRCPGPPAWRLAQLMEQRLDSTSLAEDVASMLFGDDVALAAVPLECGVTPALVPVQFGTDAMLAKARPDDSWDEAMVVVRGELLNLFRWVHLVECSKCEFELDPRELAGMVGERLQLLMRYLDATEKNGRG